jgi:flagellar biosynthesis protein FlhG
VRESDEDREAWELLGLSPGASVDEIRRVYQHLARTLAPGSLTLYSVLEPHEQHDLQRRLHAAYRHLLERAGAATGDEHRPVAVEPKPRKRPAPRPAVPALAPQPSVPEPPREAAAALEVVSGPAPEGEQEFGGPALRARREAAGITLAELSRRTRIRGAMIESVEAEAYDRLPPRVYLRGFVLALARELKLDGERVWQDYERRRLAASGPTG